MIEIELTSKGGAFYLFSSDAPSCFHKNELDFSDAIFLCSHRVKPSWPIASTGNSISEVPTETQFIIFKNEDIYTVCIALVDRASRSYFEGGEKLYLCSETGDTETEIASGVGMYCISGKNPYELIRIAVEEIEQKLSTFKLRNKKHKPEFMKYFGWCTWNALGIDVSGDKIYEGIESFGNYKPKFFLLDDGWQSTNNEYGGQGEWKLSSFDPKPGFDLKEIVDKCKNIYDVKSFYVWHATMGYWGGVDPKSPEMKKFKPEIVQTKYADTLHKTCESSLSPGEVPYGLVDKNKIFDFYNEYHKKIASFGVDGVKIDTQNYVETVGQGRGGRSVMSEKIRDGMEASTQLNFGGELINCMCGQNDVTFRLKASNMVRTSDDFFLDQPSSHAVHIYINAVNSIIVRNMAWCDWDMFMTDHEYGEYHAMSRAVSGGPVYVTDEVGVHNFDVISHLVLSDGTLPLCTDVAVPKEECLMMNPFTEQKPFIISNSNKFGRVEAAFNMNNDGCEVTGVLDNKAYSFNKGCIVSGEYSLSKIGCDIFTYADVKDGFGVYGLAEKYNSGGTVVDFNVYDGTAYITLNDIGTLCVYCDHKPQFVICNGKSVKFDYDESGLLKAKVDDVNIVIK